MPWQQYVADVAMELDELGNLFYERVIITVPRQSGKTTLVLPVFTHRSVAEFPGNRLDIGPQKQTVAYTAQTRNDARKKWIKEFLPLLEKSPFRHQFDKRLTNGSEGMDWSNGSTFDLVATMEKSGHGDTLDLGIIDEAFAQIDDRLEQALEPAMITRLASQLWIISTAGENELKSPFLWDQVRAGRASCESDDDGHHIAYFEWSVGDDEDADDIDVVAARHPAVGHTITVEDLEAKRRQFDNKGDMAGFRRAYCNMWGAVEALRDAKLPAARWSAAVTKSPPAPQVGEISIAYDVSLDGAWGSIAIGVGDLTGPYVELIEHQKGAGWIPKMLVELVQIWDPIAVGCNGAGPAGAQVAAVREAFTRAGIDPNLLRQMSAPEYKQACGGFYSDVVEDALDEHGEPIQNRPRLLTSPSDQGPLDLAASDASERSLGDAWAWDIRSATVPISPLVSVTIARALLPEAKVLVDAAANVW